MVAQLVAIRFLIGRQMRVRTRVKGEAETKALATEVLIGVIRRVEEIAVLAGETPAAATAERR